MARITEKKEVALKDPQLRPLWKAIEAVPGDTVDFEVGADGSVELVGGETPPEAYEDDQLAEFKTATPDWSGKGGWPMVSKLSDGADFQLYYTGLEPDVVYDDITVRVGHGIHRVERRFKNANGRLIDNILHNELKALVEKGWAAGGMQAVHEWHEAVAKAWAMKMDRLIMQEVDDA